MDTRALKILLLANYHSDAQQSMERFAQMMVRGLEQRGHKVKIVRPQAQLAGGDTTSGLAKWLGYFDKYVLFPPDLNAQLAWSDVVHICDHSNSVYIEYLQHVPHVITCHDLLAVRSGLGEETYCPLSPLGKILQRWILQSLRKAQSIACDSLATFNDVKRLASSGIEKQIRTISLGLNYPFRKTSEDTSLSVLSSVKGLIASEPYVLHVGSGLYRKNRDGVIRIFAKVKDRFAGQLVFVGAPLSDTEWALAESLGIKNRIVVIDKADDHVLEAFYNRAFVLLFPSRAEGFGWPIIEAQACGCPVITSDRDSCPEVAGSGGIVVGLDNESGFADAVLSLLDGQKRNDLIKLGFENLKQFDADRTVDRYISLYRETISRASHAG